MNVKFLHSYVECDSTSVFNAETRMSNASISKYSTLNLIVNICHYIKANICIRK